MCFPAKYSPTAKMTWSLVTLQPQAFESTHESRNGRTVRVQHFAGFCCAVLPPYQPLWQQLYAKRRFCWPYLRQWSAKKFKRDNRQRHFLPCTRLRSFRLCGSGLACSCQRETLEVRMFTPQASPWALNLTGGFESARSLWPNLQQTRKGIGCCNLSQFLLVLK